MANDGIKLITIMELKKVIIPAGGLGIRFLPISKVVPKELLPLVDRPMISYVVKEAKEAGFEQAVFVVSETQKTCLEYFKPKVKLEKTLTERNSKEALDKLKDSQEDFSGISFSSVIQKAPNGDGDAILKAKKQIGKAACGVMFNDDIFQSRIPALTQLKNVFDTSEKTIVGLKKIVPNKLSSYGVVRVEKIANSLYKIKGIVEKPAPGQAPSDLAICGRYILTPDVFTYLEKTKPTTKGEIILAEALKLMLEDGQIVYGCEIEGEWLECGKTIDWIKSNITLALSHPQYGPAIKDWLKKHK